MTYNVVTNIHAAHKLFVTTAMVKMPIVVKFTTMSNGNFTTIEHHVQKLTCKFYKVLQFCKCTRFKKGEILPFLGHKKGEILPFLKIRF